MYSLFTYMYHKFRPNEGKYTIHWASGVIYISWPLQNLSLVVRRVRVCWPSIFVTPPYPQWPAGCPATFLAEGGIGGVDWWIDDHPLKFQPSFFLYPRQITINHTIARWWFQIFFIFTPKIGEDSHFDEYFSNGLVQPPTSKPLEL